MTNNDLKMKRKETRKNNASILNDIGFVKIKTSSLYQKGEKAFILSPGIAKGMHGKYWFDVRLENLNKIEKISGAKSWMLLRIVPDLFAFFPLSRIREHTKNHTQEDRAHSGKVWGFYCEINQEKMKIRIYSKMTSPNHSVLSYSTTVAQKHHSLDLKSNTRILRISPLARS